MKKKIFMAGVGGMLGEAFYANFKSDYVLKCTDKTLTNSWLEKLDFSDYSEYRSQVIDFQPDYLFHIGANTSLEYCEQNPDETYLYNSISVSHAIRIAKELSIPLLYISTAGIFNGNKDLYDDWDLPDPLGVYARSKYIGELEVKSSGLNYLICRAGWMMGGGPSLDKKFINKIVQQVRAGKKTLHIVNDRDGTPTYTHDFAKNVKILLEGEHWGLYNLVCKGETSRLEVAMELLELLGVSDDINVEIVNSDFFKKEYFAERPPSERLTNYKLDLMGLNVMRDWKEALKEYVTEYYL